MKPIPLSANFAQLEQEVLQYWSDNSIFWKSLDKNKCKKAFIFYDGPPFASGLPHYGHILTSYVKDTVPRYFTMKGYFVDRRWGWDCHGLPVEYEVEKILGISGKTDIQKYGIDKFNLKCRDTVLLYADEWEKTINRIGRWVDFSRQYRTMDRDFMETVIWLFSKLYKKGLVYQSPKVVAYCNRCMTPLSNFEAGLDDSFRERDDTAITVRFRDAENPRESYLAWTTTPWTLPGNEALAVNRDILYSKLKITADDYVWMAHESIEVFRKYLGEGFIEVDRQPGVKLVGRHYTPLFEYVKGERVHTILAGDFVNISMGTGIVHLAPAYGEDDYDLCSAAGLPLFDPIDKAGRFTKIVPDLRGIDVFASNKLIISGLKERGALFKQESYRHKYPHCWRCDSPLIYRVVDSWYIKVAENRECLIANNEKIRWVPSHIGSGRFKQWLSEARDWCVSRSRFWGTPLPIWQCSDCNNIEVVSSVKELEEKTGQEITDWHRPVCDGYTWPCSNSGCQGRMSRVEEVLDCWFESGAMPYAQVHYPFENEEWFNRNFPASFIVEYTSQTRGWLYTLLIESGLLLNEAPFTNAICHGVILAEDGRKMSKRLKNFPDPLELVNKYGSDALRIYLLSSPVLHGQDIRFSERHVKEAVRRYLMPYWNVVHFFTSYASLFKEYAPHMIETAKTNGDRHILSEVEELRNKIESSIESYDLPRCYSAILDFIEVLSGWYVRLNRPRFWAEELNDDTCQVLDTLYTVLIESSQIFAPFMPFTMEYVYKHLTGESVHLSEWPKPLLNRVDINLQQEVRYARVILGTIRRIREQKGIPLKQPLQYIHVAGVEQKIIQSIEELIKEQSNVKSVIYHKNAEEFAQKSVQLDLENLGPILKEKLGAIIEAVENQKYEIAEDGRLLVGNVELSPQQYNVQWFARNAEEGIGQNQGIVVALTLEISDDLLLEGVARQLNRILQDERKRLDLPYDQRIILCIEADGLWAKALERHQSWLTEQTLTREIQNMISNAAQTVKNEYGNLKYEIREIGG